MSKLHTEKRGGLDDGGEAVAGFLLGHPPHLMIEVSSSRPHSTCTAATWLVEGAARPSQLLEPASSFFGACYLGSWQ
jgi:hypothetical protein